MTREQILQAYDRFCNRFMKRHGRTYCQGAAALAAYVLHDGYELRCALMAVECDRIDPKPDLLRGARDFFEFAKAMEA